MNFETRENTSVETECKNCKNKFNGLYCNNCGQKVIQERNTLKHFFELITDSFDIERGLLYTTKILFTNPGKIINEYLDGRTKDYYNPLKYLLLLAGLSAIIMIGTDIFDANVGNTNEFFGLDNQKTKFQSQVNAYIKSFLNIIPFLTLPFYSLISKWIFKKFKLNYAEHLIMNCYLFGQITLITLLLLFVIYLSPSLIVFFQVIGIVIFVVYFSYSLKSIFKISIVRSFFASIGIYSLGMLLFFIFIVVTMFIVMIILKLSGSNLKELVM